VWDILLNDLPSRKTSVPFCMKNIVKHLPFLFIITALVSVACNSKHGNTQSGKLQKRDTLYVEYTIDNIDSFAKASGDSTLLKQIYNDSAQMGEFVSAAYKIRMPLLPQGYVNDYVHLFTPAQIASLDSLIGNYEKETTNQVAIMTIDTQWIKIDSFDNFVIKAHNIWGVGRKDKNNGILIGICPGYRKMRFSFGYGIEKALINEATQQIIETFIIPAYRKGNYFEGTRDALLEIMKRVREIK
jgi:uncharacterized protein